MKGIKTIEQLCDYIAENSDRIATRVFVDGKWQSLFLTEMPTEIAIGEALRFVKEGIIPVKEECKEK